MRGTLTPALSRKREREQDGLSCKAEEEEREAFSGPLSRKREREQDGLSCKAEEEEREAFSGPLSRLRERAGVRVFNPA